jgi:glycosyltransferase involved in cell wall biosynthesis
MNTFNSYRAIIPPVPENTPRPLWSVMIPTYNCANYLRETLTSVLAQDPGSDLMQIEVIDDCSTKDDAQAVVEELGKGRVGFYRQPQNVGHTKNFETCVTRSRGQLVHLLHGDDCVKEGFYRKLQLAFEENPEIGAAFCRPILMDENSHSLGTWKLEEPESGILSNWLERIAVDQCIQTPSIAVRRDVYEKLGGFDTRLSWVEDWEMWVRIAAHYSMWYEVEPLALYRIHSSSNTGRYIQTGENIRDLRRAIQIMQPYLPSLVAKQLSNQARENWALYGIQWIVPKLMAGGYLKAAAIQIQESLKLSSSFKIMMELNHVILQITNSWIKKQIKSRINLQTIY